VTATLSAVAGGLRRAERHGRDVEVVDATHDSRQVAPGWLFCAIPGARDDGHRHAPDAVASGAAALLVERWLDLPVPQVRVPSVRAAVGQAAAIVHGRPSEQLTVVGVTGTNGKTSITYLLEGRVRCSGARDRHDRDRRGAYPRRTAAGRAHDAGGHGSAAAVP
jgi:UDP-N-acetylmuramoyl-L-alanyl-D-glutamate--2,6-diaminopimelate ligase